MNVVLILILSLKHIVFCHHYDDSVHIILKPHHTAFLRSPEWALSSLSMAMANSQTEQYHPFNKFTGPFNGLVI